MTERCPVCAFARESHMPTCRALYCQVLHARRTRAELSDVFYHNRIEVVRRGERRFVPPPPTVQPRRIGVPHQNVHRRRVAR
jgi:hypothetical protein